MRRVRRKLSKLWCYIFTGRVVLDCGCPDEEGVTFNICGYCAGEFCNGHYWRHKEEVHK